MRKYACIMLCGAALVAFLTATPASGADKKLKVAGVVFQEDQFMKLVQLGYAAAAKDNGAEVNLANTNGDTAKEAELVNTYVAQNYDGIAICPINQTTSVQVLKIADEDGVKIACSNLELDNAPFIVGGYTSNQYDLCVPTGKAAHDFIMKNMKGKKSIKVAALQAESVLPQVSADRLNGFFDQIKDIPGVELVAKQDAWLQDRAIQVVDGILSAHPDLDIVYGFNDGSTIGSVMAIKNAGLEGKCFVFGIDASEQAMALLQNPDNILQVVTGQDPYTMGYKTMELLIKALKGGDISATKGKILYTDYIRIDRGDDAKIKWFLDDLKSKMQ